MWQVGVNNLQNVGPIDHVQLLECLCNLFAISFDHAKLRVE